MPAFPKPNRQTLLFQDRRLYVCLASQPFADGHVIVVWKKNVADLHALSCREYAHLMHVVDAVRDAMLKFFKTKKVYLIYMDEFQHVHWHLLPRFAARGFKIVLHQRPRQPNLANAAELRRQIAATLARHRLGRKAA